MKLTQKRVKELIASNTKDRDDLSVRFTIACGRKNRKDMEIISKYRWLGGQIYAYQKILQIMRLRVN